MGCLSPISFNLRLWPGFEHNKKPHFHNLLNLYNVHLPYFSFGNIDAPFRGGGLSSPAWKLPTTNFPTGPPPMVLSLSVLEKQRIPSSGAEFMLVKNPEAGSGVAGRCFPKLGGQQSRS